MGISGKVYIFQIKNKKYINMTVSNLTTKYSLTKVGENYQLNFGTLQHKQPVVAKIRFDNININNFNVKVTCGCSAAEKQIMSQTALEYNITYNAATFGEFNKTVIITNGKQKIELELTGKTK